MAWNMSNILVNGKKAISNAGGGGSSDLTERVSALETTVGDETGGLVKEVDDLQTAMSSVLPLVFSTTDTKIGKWGSDDLYAVLVDGGTMTGATLDIDYTLPQDATMRLLFGYGVTSNAFIPLSFVNTSQVANSIAIYYDSENSKIKIVSGASEAGTTITVIVLYSKYENTRKKGGKK